LALSILRLKSPSGQIVGKMDTQKQLNVPLENRQAPGAVPQQGVALMRHSGVTIWSKVPFVVDFRNLLFGRDFDLSFSKGYSLMKIFNL
jgi:hypothetical protein